MYQFLKSTQELQAHLTVSGKFDVNLIKAQQNRIVERYLLPVMGKKLLDELQSLYNSSDIKESAYQPYEDLLRRVQAPLAHFSYLKLISSINVQQTSGGFMVAKAEGKEVASKWRIDELREDVFTEAYEGLSELIGYLESNADEFADYEQGDAYNQFPTSFLQDLTTFRKYISSLNNAYIFFQCRPIIARIEECVFKPLLQTQLWEHLTELIASGDDLGDDSTVVNVIRGALAHRVMREAIPELRIKLGNDGYTVFNQEGARGDTRALWSASSEHIQEIRSYHDRHAQNYMDALQSLLDSGDVEQYEPDTPPEEEVVEEEFNPRTAYLSDEKKSNGPIAFFG